MIYWLSGRFKRDQWILAALLISTIFYHIFVGQEGGDVVHQLRGFGAPGYLPLSLQANMGSNFAEWQTKQSSDQDLYNLFKMNSCQFWILIKATILTQLLSWVRFCSILNSEIYSALLKLYGHSIHICAFLTNFISFCLSEQCFECAKPYWNLRHLRKTLFCNNWHFSFLTDNHPVHQTAEVHRLITATGALLRFLPPYCPH